MRVFDLGRKPAVWRVEFSPDGTMLVASTDVAPRVFNVATGEHVVLTNTYFWNGTHASFHPSGRWLIGTGIGRGGPLIHDFQTGESFREDGERYEIHQAAFTADGKMVLYSGAPYGGTEQLVCRSWKDNGRLGPGWVVPLDPDADFPHEGNNGLAVLADGNRFITTDYSPRIGGRLVLRSLATGHPLAHAYFPTSKGKGPGLAVAPDDAFVVAHAKNVLHIWPAIEPGAKHLPDSWEIENPELKHYTGLAFHPSGRYLAAASNDATVKFYDTTTWAVAHTFSWTIGQMRSIAFSRDGTLAAAGSDTGKVVLWDVDV
jgi:WD40 repeat protein